MTPELKTQDCVDHDPIEAWSPTNPAEIDYLLCLHIGPVDGRGADLFYVRVLSEEAARRLNAGELAERKTIVLRDYSWGAVLDAVNSILRRTEGSDWSEIAENLSQKFDWEFESYQPYERA